MVAVTWVVVSRPPARAVTLVAFSGTAASTLGSAATASARNTADSASGANERNSASASTGRPFFSQNSP